MDEGINAVKISQGVQTITPAINELEAAYISGRIKHRKDDLIRWCLSNIIIHENPNTELKKFNKAKGGTAFPDGKPIDPFIALMNALLMYLDTPDEEEIDLDMYRIELI